MLVCSWSAGLAACLASGSDTLVPCSRMTPLSRACLIYLACRPSRVPPRTQTLSKCSIIAVVANKNAQKKPTTSVCLHSNPHPVRSVDVLKNILSEAASVLYAGLPLWHACECVEFDLVKFLGLEKHWKYSCSQTVIAG